MIFATRRGFRRSGCASGAVVDANVLMRVVSAMVVGTGDVMVLISQRG